MAPRGDSVKKGGGQGASAYLPPPHPLPICLTSSLYVPVQSYAISRHVPSVVRRNQAGVVHLTLRHPCPRCLKPRYSLTRLLQEPNGFRFVPRLLPRRILPALLA